MSEQPSAISQPSGETLGVGRRGRERSRTIALIAAIKEEIAPLVQGWNARELSRDGRNFEYFENENASGCSVAAICSGIGAEHGRRATEALIQEAKPSKVVSVGYAGALDGSLRIGDIVQPRIVVNAGDGSRTDTGAGQGALVSYPEVADHDQKRRLGEAYGAVAVDMEGASAAQAAQAHGIEFAALKAISDTMEFAMPPVQKFVGKDGRFRKLAFGGHVAVRPWLWWRTIALARNSAKASKALCKAIQGYLNEQKCEVAESASHQIIAGT